MPPSSREYRIVRLLLAEGDDFLSRIKSVGEPFDGIAKEHELSSRGLRKIPPSTDCSFARGLASRPFTQASGTQASGHG
jgi:hypothetical protein